MDGDTLCSIGELARRTGLTVKTVRFYSDRGIVAPMDRSPAGYRLYGVDAVARLGLVRTLRELGLDLATIRKVVDRELSLGEVAAVHAEVLAAQMRVLRLRHAVLVAVAERGATPEETELMHRLAQLTQDERRCLIGEFLDVLDLGPAFAGVMRSMTPELPDNPDAEQVQAWVELAELSLDPEFRSAVRQLGEELVAEQAAEQASSATTVPRRDIAAVVRDQAEGALAAGVDPASSRADPIVEAVTAHYAQLLGRPVGRPDDGELRRRLAARLERVNDPRRERYLQLLAVVNGWPAPESLAPALEWSVQALRARTPR